MTICNNRVILYRQFENDFQFQFMRYYMKKTFAALCLILVLLLTAVSCSHNDSTKDEKLDVVVTAFPHYDFVRQIAGDNVNLTMLLKPGNEMHSYEPSPSDMAKISCCDIFVYTGGESDSWAKSILDSADNKDMTVISFTDICPATSHVHGEEDTCETDSHSHTYDEHVWTSPVNAIKICEHIYSVLCSKDIQNTEEYTQNYDSFYNELCEIDSLFRDAVASGKRREIVVGDRFPFTHLVNEYGIEYTAAFPGCSSQTEPSAKTVAAISQKVKNEGIPVVFTVEFSNKKIANTIVSGTDAQICTLHSCHNVTSDGFTSNITYSELMRLNAENIRKALS